MIRAVRFAAVDLSLLQVQQAQLPDWPDGDSLHGRAKLFEQAEHCYTFINNDAKIVACAGLLSNHADCMTAWAVLSELAVAEFLAVTRWLRNYLDNLPCRRFDMMVRGGFTNAHQWARLLRFEHEGVQRAWFPDGDDMHVYARVRAGA